MVQLFWKAIWHHLIKQSIYICIDPVILFLAKNPKKLLHCFIRECIRCLLGAASEPFILMGPLVTLRPSEVPGNLPCTEFVTTMKSEVTQSCTTLCDPMDCSPPGSSIHGILQARILEWVSISFSRGSSQPRDRTQVSRIGGRRFNL